MRGRGWEKNIFVLPLRGYAFDLAMPKYMGGVALGQWNPGSKSVITKPTTLRVQLRHM